MKSLFRCISCSQNQGDTQIRIKSSCFDKPIIININSEDESIQVIQDLVNMLLKKKEEKNVVSEQEV